MSASYNLLISPVKQKNNNLCNAPFSAVQHIVVMSTEPKNPPNFLRAWRLAAHMTQAELATHAGTTAAMINHLENGKRGLTHAWLTRIAPILATTPGAIIDRPPGAIDQDERMRALWSIVSPDERDRIVRVAEAMLPYTPQPDFAHSDSD
jgi:transcriptional regulator with XRE-family HTH domain